MGYKVQWKNGRESVKKLCAESRAAEAAGLGPGRVSRAGGVSHGDRYNAVKLSSEINDT